MHDLIEFLASVAGIIAAFLAGVFLLALGIYYLGTKPACEQYARLESVAISTQFFGAGCLVKYEGRWVDYDVAVSKKQEIKVSEEPVPGAR